MPEISISNESISVLRLLSIYIVPVVAGRGSGQMLWTTSESCCIYCFRIVVSAAFISLSTPPPFWERVSTAINNLNSSHILCSFSLKGTLATTYLRTRSVSDVKLTSLQGEKSSLTFSWSRQFKEGPRSLIYEESTVRYPSYQHLLQVLPDELWTHHEQDPFFFILLYVRCTIYCGFLSSHSGRPTLWWRLQWDWILCAKRLFRHSYQMSYTWGVRLRQ